MDDNKRLSIDDYTLLKTVFKSGCTHANISRNGEENKIESYDSTSIYKSVWEVEDSCNG